MAYMPRHRSERLVALAILGSLAGAILADEQPGPKIPRSEPPATGSAQMIVPQLTRSKSDDPVIRRAQEAVEVSARRYLDVEANTPWQILHGILAYRYEYRVKQDGTLISAMQYISGGPAYKGIQWFEKTPHGGRAHVYDNRDRVFEGHPNQFQAILTLSELPLEHTFGARDATIIPWEKADKELVPQVADTTITVADMIRSAQAEVNAKEEITWTLWFLSFYLDPDAQWTNKHGEPWSLERLVKMQTDAPPFNAACGGTHGLFALSRARNAYLQTGRPLRGVWLEADQKIKYYVEAARSLQNEDGSFSSNYFKGRGYTTDFGTRLATFGHTLEFLMVALPQHRLQEPWVRSAVRRLADDLVESRTQLAECGALYHAVDALVIYLQRVNPPPPIASDEAKDPVEQTGGTEPKPTEPPQLLAPGDMD